MEKFVSREYRRIDKRHGFSDAGYNRSESVIYYSSQFDRLRFSIQQRIHPTFSDWDKNKSTDCSGWIKYIIRHYYVTKITCSTSYSAYLVRVLVGW